MFKFFPIPSNNNFTILDFSHNSFLLQVMSIICTLSLRSPDNAARAIEAGAGDLAIQSMQKFPEVPQLQKSSCLMIRNLAVRNAENRQDSFSYMLSIAYTCTITPTSFGYVISHVLCGWCPLTAPGFLTHFFQSYRTLLLNHGIEKIIRTAKQNHPSCKEAATDALRDLGLNNYNL